MVLGRGELVRIPPQEVNREGTPGGEEKAERREQNRVAAQEPMRGHGRVGVRARTGRSSHGRTKKGEMIATALRFPYFTGSVMQPPARSPSASEKSFVEVAPRRKSPKSTRSPRALRRMRRDRVQPATLRRHPRGIAIVTFAQMPRRFVLPNAGTE